MSLGNLPGGSQGPPGIPSCSHQTCSIDLLLLATHYASTAQAIKEQLSLNQRTLRKGLMAVAEILHQPHPLLVLGACSLQAP
eukprot:1159043-Pelagomonas_calceolata.AAC.3